MRKRTIASGSILLFSLIFVFIGQNLRAQQTPAKTANSSSAPPAFTLRRTVNRVLLDVVVTDQHGKPVTGLEKDDFTIREDIQPQRALSFDTHNFGDSMDYTPIKLPPHPANTFVNLPATPERGPLYVLLYDLANIPVSDQAYARKQLLNFIHDKPAGTRFAIFVASDGLHLVQGFTADQETLFAALDPKSPRPHVPMMFLMGDNFGAGDKLYSANELSYIAHYLAGMPGRKNLVWFASSFPLTLFVGFTDVNVYQEAIKQTIDLLAANQIAVYPVDTQGVVIAEVHAPGDAPGDASSGSPSRGGGASSLDAGYANEEQIARETGGHAFYSTNDFKDALEKATNLGGSYYTLSYAPSNKNYDGKIRKIEVELDRKGYQLSYRRSYYGADADAPPETKQAKKEAATTLNGAPVNGADDALSASMEHGAPIAHQLIFGARVRLLGAPALGTPQEMLKLANLPAFAQRGRPKAVPKALAPIPLQTYAIDFTMTAHQFLSMGETAPSLVVAVAAYDANGDLLNAAVNMVPDTDGNQQPGAKEGSPFRVEQRLLAPLGAKFIRIGVRDASTDRTGAMEITLPLAPENAVAQTH